MADWGQPRPRHQYTYMPRPGIGQRGALVYNGSLNQTAAMQGYGAYGAGMMGGMGLGAGAYYGNGSAYGVGYGARYGAPYYPSSSYYPNNYYHGGYGNPYGYGASSGYYNRYANCFYPWQSSYYYRAGAVAPVSSYAVVPGSAYYSTTATQAAPVQYTYVQAAATPKKLPDVYHTANYTVRLANTIPATAPIAEDIQLENRRIATERGAYKPRRIKPADAHPDDMFWVREKDGQWHLRKYYEIENDLHPGRWQMDAEIGFLVFHRE